MFQFKRMMNSARVHGIRSMADGADGVMDFGPTSEDAHIFVFEPRSMESAETLDLMPDELDLPFACCSFEVLGNDVIVRKRGGVSDQQFLIKCILIKEYGPKDFGAWFLMCNETGIERIIYRRKGRSDDHWLTVVGSFLKRLREEKIGIENIGKERVKLLNSDGKKKDRVRVIRKIVRVAPCKYVSAARPVSGREIDWTHRWEVRGHWRKTHGLGKDRAGDYCVDGYTWVTEHIRGGDEDAPLIKKVRYVPEVKTRQDGIDKQIVSR